MSQKYSGNERHSVWLLPNAATTPIRPSNQIRPDIIGNGISDMGTDVTECDFEQLRGVTPFYSNIIRIFGMVTPM